MQDKLEPRSGGGGGGRQGDTGHCGKQNTGARTFIIHQEPRPAFASAQETKHCSAEGSVAALESKRPRIGVGGGSAHRLLTVHPRELEFSCQEPHF